MIRNVNLKEPKRVHIVGIGGSGTFYLAKFLHLLGWKVQGSDLKQSENLVKLREFGIKVFLGHNTSNLDTYPELIITSPAVPTTVPELNRARREKIRILPYHLAISEIHTQLKAPGGLKQVEKPLKESNFAPLYFLDLSNIRVIGVTGTDGKTTTCSMIHHITKNAGKKTGIITTVFARIGDKEIDTGLHTTTPPSQELAPIVEQIINEGAELLIIEMTSHGLAQFRVEGIPVDTAVFTNISEEHLDFHSSWDKLVRDKGKMISMVRKGGKTILNISDKSYDSLLEIAKKREVTTITYGFEKGVLSAHDVQSKENSITAELNLQETDSTQDAKFHLSLPILGEYNISNAMAAILACREEGISISDSVNSLSTFKTVGGRMEIIQSTPFYTIVDFAHTPKALEQSLIAASKLKGKDGRLIAVFGCAGLRDVYKRSKMGKIASDSADIVVLTAEDPRTEKLSDINDQIIAGIKKPITIMRFDQDDPSSRKDAIDWAVKNAKAGDVVISAGKGHEKSLCFGTTEYPWSDIDVMKKALSSLTTN